MEFKLEKDDFWWERLRFEDMGVPVSFAKKYLNFVLPDKLFHFMTCYGLTLLFSLWFSPLVSFGCAAFIMIGLWEVLWDGFYRHGFSVKDLVFDLMGMATALGQLYYPDIGIQIYLFTGIKGFLALWAYSLVSDESKKEVFIILLSLCLISTKGFAGDFDILKHLSFLAGAGICFWWNQNPIIGQGYEYDK